MLGLTNNHFLGAAAGAAGVIAAVSDDMPKAITDQIDKFAGAHSSYVKAFLGGALVGLATGGGMTSKATLYRGLQGAAGYYLAKEYGDKLPDFVEELPNLLGMTGRAIAAGAAGGLLAAFATSKIA